jgi:D-sedoheptulose 7-phosphate isomerase
MKIPFPQEVDESLAGPVSEAYALILETLKNGGTVFACGNGGSCADAMHFTAELTGRYKKERGPLRALALGMNVSEVTAIGNDYGFEHIFERPLSALARKGDCLIGFSTSGTSKNVVAAWEKARELGVKTIGLTGNKPISAKLDAHIAVPSPETGRIQEMHERIHHYWCENLDEDLS